MPFLACCSCGLAIEGDCSQHGELAVAQAVRHLQIADGHIVHDDEVSITSLPIRPYGYRHVPAIHPSERAVVWMHPKTGEVRYPDRNDRRMPERYARQGFVRHDLPTLHSVERFERDHNVQNEAAWFDQGSGRSFLEEG